MAGGFDEDVALRLKEAHFIRFEFSDLHGISRSKVVSTRLLLSRSSTYDTSLAIYAGVLGMSLTSTPVMIPEVVGSGLRNTVLVPHWRTLVLLPKSEDERYTTARVLCEPSSPWEEGEALDAHPRTLCRRLLKELEDCHGYRLQGALEYEFSLGKLSDTCSGKFIPLWDERPTFSTFAFSRVEELLYDLERDLAALGIMVNTMNLEYGRGQIEVTTTPVWGIDIADHAFTFRLLVKEFFARRGLHATFMCKPNEDPDGAANGGHFNHSLWGAAGNAFVSDGGGLSRDAEKWVSGILEHSKGLQALAAPTMSCYTRVRAWSWAPTHATFGEENRTAAIRAKVGGEKGTYLEWRAPSATASPYLVLAGALAAGMAGLQQGGTPVPVQGSAYESTAAPEAKSLPKTLRESLEALEADAILRGALGDRFVRWFLQVKRHELQDLDEDKFVFLL